MTESSTERIKKIEEKIAQLKEQKQAILARHKTAQRKAKTQHLIHLGT